MDNPKSNFTFEDFPIGQNVKVFSKCVDFTFFYGETGFVVKNSGKYLGISVEFDEPRVYEDGRVEKTWNFNPQNLIPIEGKREIYTDIQVKAEINYDKFQKFMNSFESACNKAGITVEQGIKFFDSLES